MVVSLVMGLGYASAGWGRIGLRDHVHFAAGIAICVAAGCVVTDLRGDPLPPDGDGRGMLAAADAATHAALLDVVRRLSGDRLAP